MFCNKCGRIMEDGAKFCSKCGAKVENAYQSNTNVTPKIETINEQPNNSVNQASQNFDYNNQNINYNQQYQNYDNIINPSMKKYAILSIVIPAISIFVYWNIGLTIYIAMLLAALGFNFAKKGRLYNKTMSTIGYVLNTILVVMAIFMFFAILIERFA